MGYCRQETAGERNVHVRLNPDYQEYVIFPAGVELNVPKVEQTTAQEESMLPPWKRKNRNVGT